jgi:hypothetical protein
MIRTAPLALVVLGVGSLAACGAASRGGETLLDSVRTYHEGVRWSRIPVAASRIPPAERADFISEWDELADDLRITDYEVVAVAEADRTAKVEIKYTWYLDSRQVVHETRAAEKWERAGKVWLKVSDSRSRGEPMPGLSEPDEDDKTKAKAEPESEAEQPETASAAAHGE